MLLITPVASFQDNQTDSGMVLASEEFERIENRHRKEGGFRYSLSLAIEASLLPHAVRPGGSSWSLPIDCTAWSFQLWALSQISPCLMRGKTQEEQTSLLFSRV